MFKQTVLLIFLLLTPVNGKFKLFKGGSSSSSSGGSHPQGQSHGFQPQQPAAPGWHPSVMQPNSGAKFGQPNTHFNQPSGGFSGNRFGGGSPHFNSGSGLGSASRGSAFKSALAGAAIGTIGGLVAFEVGKAIIHSASTPFQHDNRNYYWGPEYYQQKRGEIMCSISLEQLIASTGASTTTSTTAASVVTTVDPNAPTTTPTPEKVLSSLQFQNGTRPKQVVWGCKQGAEVCCGTDCCPAPPPPASSTGGSTGSNIAVMILIVLLVIALIACCCCFAVYKLCRSAFDSMIPSNNRRNEEYHYETDDKYGGDSQQYGQSYPMQPYPNQTQYNPQPYANNPYPAEPQQYPNPPPAYPAAPQPAYPSVPQPPYPSQPAYPVGHQAPYPDQPTKPIKY